MSRITPDQVAPLSARTQADLLSAAQQQEASSFGNTIGNAFDRDVLTAAQTLVDPIIVASRFYQRYIDSPRATSGFRLSEERLAQLTEGVDPVYWNEFAYINSEDEALIVRGQTLEKTKARATTAEAGWGGVGATLGASVFNPVSVLLGAATGVAAAAPAVNATRAARIARLIEAGAINAVPQAAVDSLVAADNADINALDVLSGAAGGFGLGAAINRFGSAGLGTRALAAGAGQAVPAYLVDQLQTERTQTEILGAFALNLAFGAGIGAISKASPIGQEFEAHGRKIAAQVDQKTLAEEGLPSSWVPPEVDQTTLRDLAGFYEEDFTPPMQTLGGVPTNTPSVRPGIVEAVQNKPQNFFVPGAVASREATFKNNYQPGDFDASGVTAAQPSLQSGRFDPVAMIGRNGTDTERLLANAIVTDPFGRADGSPASIGAENWANSRAEGITTEYLRGQDRLYRQYVDAQKKAAASLPPGTEYKIPSRTEFNGMVHYAVLRYGKTPRGTTATEIGAISDAILQDPIIQAAAKHHYDTVSKPTLEMMKRHGVRGAANIQDDPSYVSVVAKRADIDAFILAKPDNLDRLREVVAEGIVRKMRESKVDPFSTLFPVLAVQDIQQVRNRIATEIADQWIKNVGTNNEEMARASRSALSSAQLEQLVPRLAQDTGLNEQQIKSILFEFNPGEEANDVPASFLKPRIDIDYTVSKQYPDGQTVRIEDFLENDIEGIARRYIRKATGASAMAEVGRVAKERLGLQEAPSTIDDFVELARVSQRARPDDGADDLARLEILFKKTYGYPTEVPVTATGKAVVSSLRFVRALTRFRVMTTLAASINQMTEYAPLIAKHGPSMVFRAVPAAREFINEVKSGKPIAHGLMAMALRDGIGLGSVSERVNPVAPMADNTLVASGVSRAERAAGSLDRASMYLSRGQQRLSLEMYVRDFQERVAFFTAAQTWADQALGRKAKIDNPKTLADMGLTKAQYDAINAHLEKHATASDIGIDEPNLDKWTDANGKPDIRSQALYRQALLREAQFGINTGQSTLLPGWTDTTAGKMLSQLSTYGIQSYTTRFLPLLRSPDEFKTYASLLSMSVFGTMAYVTWTYMASLGMEENERRRFLERRLSDSAIAKAAFSRASFSSLAPRFIDAGLVLAGEDPAFSPQRVSGVGAGEGDQVVNILLGVPSVEQFKKTIDAAQSMTLPWLRDDYDFSQRDVRNILDGWGVPQWLNARNVIMRSVSDLPERPN